LVFNLIKKQAKISKVFEMKNETVIISDTHIGDPDFTQDRKQQFFDFLENYVKPKADELILLGDIFEITQASLLDVYRGATDLLMKLAEVALSGTKISYILGNHDLDFTNTRGIDIALPNVTVKGPKEQKLVVRREVPHTTEQKASEREIVSTFTSAEERTIKGHKVYLAHGHEYNHYFAGDPKRYDILVKIGAAIERTLGPEADDWILNFWEEVRHGISKLFYSSEETPGRIGGMREDLVSDILAARDILKFEIQDDKIVPRKEKLDVVVFGHTHRARKVKVRDDIREWAGEELGVYLNCGAWVTTVKMATFCVFRDDGSFDVYEYMGKGKSRALKWWEPI